MVEYSVLWMERLVMRHPHSAVVVVELKIVDRRRKSSNQTAHSEHIDESYFDTARSKRNEDLHLALSCTSAPYCYCVFLVSSCLQSFVARSRNSSYCA